MVRTSAQLHYAGETPDTIRAELRHLDDTKAEAGRTSSGAATWIARRADLIHELAILEGLLR